MSDKPPKIDIHKLNKEIEKNNQQNRGSTPKERFFKKLSFLNTLRHNFLSKRSLKVMGFDIKDEHGIRINNSAVLNPLYAIKLVSSSSVDSFLDNEDINKIVKKGGKYNFIIWGLINNGLFQGNYIFSHNKKLLTEIALRFGVELIKSHEMLNVLYSLTLDTEYTFDPKTNGLKSSISLDKTPSYTFVHDTFNKLINDAILDNLENYDLYQGVEYSDLKNSFVDSYFEDENGKPIVKQKTTNISELFNIGFKGAIFTYIDFNRNTAQALVSDRINKNKFLDGETSQYLKVKLDAIKNGSITPVLLNTVMLLKKDENGNEDSRYDAIGDCLGVRFKRYKASSTIRAKIIRYTPLIERNEIFTEVLDKQDINNYICSCHKDLSFEPQMFGTDHNGCFTNYNLKYLTKKVKTTREHIFIGGETGASKTTFVNAMKSQMIKFDWNTYKLGKMNGFKFREFDIKESLKPYAEFVKKHNKDSVEILETNLNKFSYNLINCKVIDGKVDKQDISFCVQTTSFILEARDKDAKLTFDEKTKLESLIENVYINKSYESITIMSLADYQEDLAEELFSLGYKPTTKLKDVKEEKYKHLKKPTLNEVVKLLYVEYTNKDIQADETKFKTVKSLRTKLESIIDLGSYKLKNGKKIPGYYSRYEAFDLDSKKKWLLFDMNTVKDNEDDYGPIQWILINRMIRQDMKDQLALRKLGLAEPKIIYFLEEAHNIFGSEMFKNNNFFEKAAREWRSYNIILCVITQKSRHIPREVYEAIETKFFLFPGAETVEKNKGEGKKVQIFGIKDKKEKEPGIKDLLGLNQKEVELMFKVPTYTAVAVGDSGTFTIKLHTTEKMRQIFDNKYKEPEVA